jgi:hypothetical protein
VRGVSSAWGALVVCVCARNSQQGTELVLSTSELVIRNYSVSCVLRSLPKSYINVGNGPGPSGVTQVDSARRSRAYGRGHQVGAMSSVLGIASHRVDRFSQK